ncbi:hypothetical protein B0H10DRAFT_1966392 [Mycena sp. CBHHK59/15]|nr:hypothetical protein B0H10DRAFT_1966392 [Mycena sp. CBHHK59/15]
MSSRAVEDGAVIDSYFSFVLPSVPETPGSGHGRSLSLQGSFTGGTGTDFGDGPPPGSSVLGRRKRPESMAEWSPPTKARLKTYTEDVASEYGVPESNREDFLNASTLSTHKLMIVTLGVVLGRREDASSESRLTEYLGSSELKENVISHGVLLDPKIPSYKIGFLDRLMVAGLNAGAPLITIVPQGNHRISAIQQAGAQLKTYST